MSLPDSPAVLVLDADMVPALTIARSLARRGCTVTVASHTDHPLGSYSRYVTSSLKYPDPLADTRAFVDWVAEHTRRQHYDLVIPVTERTMLALSRQRQDVAHAKVAMPAQDSLELVLDKSKTLELAGSLEVPAPQSVLVDTLEEVAELEMTLNYPVVIKPARSIGQGEAGVSQLQVSYAFDPSQLQARCRHALRFGSLLLQEFVAGSGVGIELIAQQGKISYAFQHLRLHEVPLSGGGSSLRMSEPVDPELLAASEKLIAALNWTGVAMVEFKQDRQKGSFSLMEINGRFWGSLPLADAAGADFPGMLLDLELGNLIEPYTPYRNGIACRLLSRDLAWCEAVLRRDADARIVAIPPRWHVVRDLAIMLSPRHRFDVQSWRDPLPGLIDIGRIFRSYGHRFTGLVHDYRFSRVQRRAWSSGRVEELVGKSSSILFLCYGNINRSALADTLVRGYAEDSGIAISSAGFHPDVDRPADPVMVDVARERAVDLKDSRSRCVTAQMLARSNLVFVMEKSHYDRLVGMDPALAPKVFLLGAHQNGSGWPAEIEDPYGKPREEYLHCFERIEEAIDNVKAFISSRSKD